ncbi:MAG: glycosyltransferase [Cellulophaga sp.]|nr:glycosyltransferase [Cellulophaga sp.]
MPNAPIAVFVYKRLEPLKATIASLAKNTWAQQSELYIFSDGAGHPKDEKLVQEVRDFLKTITGFENVTIVLSEGNKGLATSIILGVSKVFETFDRIIVLEDDLISSPNFLVYMNSALEYYKDRPEIFSIAGYSPSVNFPDDYTYDVYFTQRASSWGWATYRKQWEGVDWKVKGYKKFKTNFLAQLRFNRMGSDMSGMLAKQMKGKLDSWAIRWCFHQFQHNLYTVFPKKSKIVNIGFTAQATNTNNTKLELRFATALDATNQQNFNFKDNVALTQCIVNQFIRPYSLKTRVLSKIRIILGR